MDSNITDNTYVSDVIKKFSGPIENITKICENASFDIYISKEQENQTPIRIFGYIFAIIIILSNLTVVISSGLILNKGQQPKNTYMLLGNVSLADTLIGVAILIGVSVENLIASDMLCILQIGMLVTQSKVSVLSVGLIAVDRYIYILHGLYYHRWLNTTRMRIAILCVWVIGIACGFAPLTGWVNEDLVSTHCIYFALFPGPMIVLNSCISLTIILIVAILYTNILKCVITNFRNIKVRVKPISDNDFDEQPKLRIHRGHGNHITNCFAKCQKNSEINFNKSPSFNTNYSKEIPYNLYVKASFKTKTDENIISLDTNRSENYPVNNKTLNNVNKSDNGTLYKNDSTSNIKIRDVNKVDNNKKRNEPNKFRSIAIVTFTSCGFISTWTPYLIVVIIFVFCEEKHCNTRCMYLNYLLSGPLGFLALLNSILNPLIYAWWHKGFKDSIKLYYKKYFSKNLM